MPPTSTDVAWIDVLPNMSRFLPELQRALGSGVGTLGAQAGSNFGSGFQRSALNGVQQASSALSAARRKEADEAGKVRIAEQRLADVRSNSRSTQTQITQATEQLARAQRGLDAAHDNTIQSTRNLSQAQQDSTRRHRDTADATDHASRRSKVLTGAMAQLGAAIASVSVGALVRGLYEAGAVFDDVADNIRVKTGLTGQSMAALEESVKRVGANVPHDFRAVGAAVTDLHQRLGLTGPTLEKLASQVLEVGRMTGEELDVQELTKAFAVFNVTGDQTTAVMDELFRVSQATGLGVNQLVAGLVKGGPTLQQFGLGVGQSAALLGSFDKAGLNSDAMIVALRKGLVEFSKEGEDANAALSRAISEIQRYTKEGNNAAAIELAAKLFGTKNAAAFVQAVQTGTLNVEALTAATSASGDTILGVAEETKDLSERWREFRNGILLTLEPAASAAFGAMGRGMGAITDRLRAINAQGNPISALVAAFQAGGTDITSSGFNAVMEVVGQSIRRAWDFASGLASIVGGALAAGFRAAQPAIGSIGASFGSLYPVVQAVLDVVRFLVTTIFQQLAPVIEQLVPIVARLVAMFAQHLMVVLNVLAPLLPMLTQAFTQIAQVVARALMTVLQALGPVLGQVLDILAEVAIMLARTLLQALNAIMPVLPRLLDVFVLLVENAIVPLLPLLPMLAELFGGIVTALAPILPTLARLIALMVDLAIRVLGPLLPLLPPVIDLFLKIANVFGAVLVGAIRGLATAFTWLLDSVFMPVVRAIADASEWLENTIMRPVFAAITAAWNALSTAFKWAWENIIRPAWTAIQTAATVLFRILTVAVFLPIKLAWEALTAAIRFAWENVLRPVWTAIQTAATVLFRILTVAVFLPIKLAWDALLAGIRLAWENVLRPTWNAIQAAAQFMWNNILRPVWAAMRAAWDALLVAFRWAWENVLRPTWNAVQAAAQFLWDKILRPVFGAIRGAWDGLMNAMRAVYDRVIHPMWQIIKTAIDAVKRAFEAVVAGIQKAWNGLMYILATPINFVIGVIFNKGLFRAWNWAIENLGLPASWRAPTWAQIPEGKQFAHGGQVGDDRYAGGGEIRGPWRGPRADNVMGWVPGAGPIRVNPREWIHPVDAVDYYGDDAMAAIQHKRIPREQLALLAGGGMIPGLATGGSTWEAMWSQVRAAHPSARLTSSVRPGDPGYHGRGQAIDVAGAIPYPNNTGRQQMLAINQWMANRWGGNITELIHTPGINLWHGAPHTYNAGTQADHWNHVHLAIDAISKVLAGATGTFTGAAVDRPWYADVWSSVTGALDWFKSKIGAVGEMVGRFGDNPFVKIIKEVPGALLSKIWEKIKGAIGGLFLQGQDVAPGDTGAAQDIVRGLAAMPEYGWGGHWDSLNRLIQGESSWNPRAQNPVSSASGLFQHITSTWLRYRPPGVTAGRMADATVSEQARAGLNYIRDVYGDPSTAYRMWSARSPHWYSGGGQVPVLDGGGYAAPGWWFNGTADVERVLSPEQTRSFDRLVAVATHGSDGDEMQLCGDLYLDSGEFLGVVQGVATAVINGRDDTLARNLRSKRP